MNTRIQISRRISRDKINTNSINTSILKIPRYQTFDTVGSKPDMLGNIILNMGTNSLCFHTGRKWISLDGSGGPRGAVGPQGPRGETGLRGIGVQGPRGETGLRGIGIQGPRGETGLRGIGVQGPRGETGPQGSMGVGVQGPRGDIGPQGSMGVGVQGPHGDIGPQGSMGVGIQGPVGPQGPGTISNAIGKGLFFKLTTSQTILNAIYTVVTLGNGTVTNDDTDIYSYTTGANSLVKIGKDGIYQFNILFKLKPNIVSRTLVLLEVNGVYKSYAPITETTFVHQLSQNDEVRFLIYQQNDNDVIKTINGNGTNSTLISIVKIG